MPWHCKNEAAVTALRQLSRALGTDMAEALRVACQNELARRVDTIPLRQRIEGLRTQLGLQDLVTREGAGRDPFEFGRYDVMFVTGSAMAACMLQDEPCNHYFAALDSENTKFTASHARHAAQRMLMDRGGLDPNEAIHGIEGFAKLGRIKTLSVGDDVRDSALRIRHALAGSNSHPGLSDDEFLDEACCRSFRMPPVLIGPGGRLGTFRHFSM